MKTIDTILAVPTLRRRSVAVGVPGFRVLASKAYALALAYRAWLQRRSSRRILRDLTGDQLCDIGLTRAEAQVEVAKSHFWDQALYPSTGVSSRSCRSPSEPRHG